jgi:hypothetical protein
MSTDKKPPLRGRNASPAHPWPEVQQRLKIMGDLMTMMHCLTTERLLELATELALEASARFKELNRPRVVVDNTVVRP